MLECPLCKAALDFEEEELDQGDIMSCEECGATLVVASLNPPEIEEAEEEFDELDEEDYGDEDEDDPWRSARGY